MGKLAPTLLLAVVLGCDSSAHEATTGESQAPPPARAREQREQEAGGDGEDDPAINRRKERFVIETREESYETFVDIHPRGREAPGWNLRLDEESLRLRWDRESPRATQVEILGAMLARLAEPHGEVLRKASLVAQLSPSAYPEYAERLARHAAEDPSWRRRLRGDMRRPGTARVHALHEHIVATTRAHSFHRELIQVFRSAELQMHLEGVEKCSDARPGAPGELGRWLEERGIRSPRPLPVGCLMAWFELEPYRSEPRSRTMPATAPASADGDR